jgi:hypothetical protein
VASGKRKAVSAKKATALPTANRLALPPYRKAKDFREIRNEDLRFKRNSRSGNNSSAAALLRPIQQTKTLSNPHPIG